MEYRPSLVAAPSVLQLTVVGCDHLRSKDGSVEQGAEKSKETVSSGSTVPVSDHYGTNGTAH